MARGIGEKLTPIKGLEGTWVLLSKPNIGVSTKEIYKAYDQYEIKRNIYTPSEEATEQGNLTTLTQNMYNVLRK